MPQVQNITTVRTIFDAANMAHLKPVTDDFFQTLDQEFPDFKGHVLVSHFSFSEAWPTWEIHPEGDELVMLLEGDTDLVLASEDGTETVMRASTPGDYIIVPKATWHTARPHAPTSMLFFTPGEGTLNALEPYGDPL